MTIIYTIGHSNHPIDLFLGLLRQHGISTLVDARSRPYSKWGPHFKKDSLARSLREEGLEYLFLGTELGGRPDGQEFYDTEGHVDYARRAQAPDFQAGIDRLDKLGRTSRTTFMCAEENPRSLSPALADHARAGEAEHRGRAHPWRR